MLHNKTKSLLMICFSLSVLGLKSIRVLMVNITLFQEGAEQMDHPRPQKRFVSNEETLVEELSGLKKLAA